MGPGQISRALVTPASPDVCHRLSLSGVMTRLTAPSGAWVCISTKYAPAGTLKPASEHAFHSSELVPDSTRFRVATRLANRGDEVRPPHADGCRQGNPDGAPNSTERSPCTLTRARREQAIARDAR